jgi:hypothetical protein
MLCVRQRGLTCREVWREFVDCFTIDNNSLWRLSHHHLNGSWEFWKRIRTIFSKCRPSTHKHKCHFLDLNNDIVIFFKHYFNNFFFLTISFSRSFYSNNKSKMHRTAKYCLLLNLTTRDRNNTCSSDWRRLNQSWQNNKTLELGPSVILAPFANASDREHQLSSTFLTFIFVSPLFYLFYA